MQRKPIALIAALAGLIAVSAPGIAVAAQTERVANGGFEGTTSPPWTFTDANPCTEAICGLAPASGLGYAANTSVSSESVPPQEVDYVLGEISQIIVVPKSPATLSFAVRHLDNHDPNAAVHLTVALGSDLTDVSSFSESFQTVTVPIPDEQTGPGGQQLLFRFLCTTTGDQPADCDRIDIDEVSLLTGADTTSPQTTITHVKKHATVASKQKRAKVPVSFKSSEANSTFKCKLDGGDYGPCDSPKTLHLKRGEHQFRVRAKDAAGNVDGSAATATIKVTVKRTT